MVKIARIILTYKASESRDYLPLLCEEESVPEPLFEDKDYYSITLQKPMSGDLLVKELIEGRRGFSGISLEVGFDFEGHRLFKHLKKYLELKTEEGDLARNPINFSDGEFLYTNMQGLCLPNIIAERTNFYGANLTGTKMPRARFKGAYFRRARLTGSRLSRADFQEAKLIEADLTEANLGRANLSEGFIRGARLKRCNLRSANLQDADLSAADLTEADLEGANLAIANLTRAKLVRTKFTRADIRGVNFSGVYLEGYILLEGAIYNKEDFEGAFVEKSIVDKKFSGRILADRILKEDDNWNQKSKRKEYVQIVNDEYQDEPVFEGMEVIHLKDLEAILAA